MTPRIPNHKHSDWPIRCHFSFTARSMYALTHVVSNACVAFVLTGLATAGVAAANGRLLSAIQSLVPESTRAVALAIVYSFANLIGMASGR